MEGKLKKNDIGRWEVVFSDNDAHELTSGDTVELPKLPGKWARFRIECEDGEYYAVGFGRKLRDGLPARNPGNRGPIGA